MENTEETDVVVKKKRGRKKKSEILALANAALENPAEQESLVEKPKSRRGRKTNYHSPLDNYLDSPTYFLHNLYLHNHRQQLNLSKY